MEYFWGTKWTKILKVTVYFCFESCLTFLWINIVNNLKLVAGFTFISFSLRLARNNIYIYIADTLQDERCVVFLVKFLCMYNHISFRSGRLKYWCSSKLHTNMCPFRTVSHFACVHFALLNIRVLSWRLEIRYCSLKLILIFLRLLYFVDFRSVICLQGLHKIK